MNDLCKGSGQLAALTSDGIPPKVDCFECGAKGLLAITKRDGFGKIQDHKAKPHRALGIRVPLSEAVVPIAVSPHEEERAAWLALVNAAMRRADAQCEPDPLAAGDKACRDRSEALATLRRLGVDVKQIRDPHGLWPKEKA